MPGIYIRAQKHSCFIELFKEHMFERCIWSEENWVIMGLFKVKKTRGVKLVLLWCEHKKEGYPWKSILGVPYWCHTMVKSIGLCSWCSALPPAALRPWRKLPNCLVHLPLLKLLWKSIECLTHYSSHNKCTIQRKMSSSIILSSSSWSSSASKNYLKKNNYMMRFPTLQVIVKR